MSKTWFKTILTDEEFLDVLIMSKNKHGIRDAALKYNCSKQVIRSRIRSNNTFKGIPAQNTLRYKYNDKSFVYKKNQHYFLFGLLASDGCVSVDRLSLTQSHYKGKKLLYFVKGVLCSNHRITQHKNANCINIKPESNLKQCLIDCNIFERKTYTYTLPSFESEEQFCSFLQGYIEGDGCTGIYDNGKGAEYLHLSLVGTKEFIYAVNERLPVKGRISNTKNELHQLTFNGINAFSISNYIYCNPIYPRGKYKNFENSYPIYKKQLATKKIYSRVLKLNSIGPQSLSVLSQNFGISTKLIYNIRWKRKRLLYQKNLNNSIKSKDL